MPNCLSYIQSHFTLLFPEVFIACTPPSIIAQYYRTSFGGTVTFTWVVRWSLKTSIMTTFVALPNVCAFRPSYIESIPVQYVFLVDFTYYNHITVHNTYTPSPAQNKRPTSNKNEPPHHQDFKWTLCELLCTFWA